MEILHAHVNSYSSDCDGPIERSFIIVTEDTERDGLGELTFKERVLALQVSFYALAGATVRLTEHGFDYDEPTEEGHRSIEVRWCSDLCDLEEQSYRDIRAEQAGY
jgi:hypothetical protein